MWACSQNNENQLTSPANNSEVCEAATSTRSLFEKYRMFNHRGNGLLNEPRVARFSATALPFPASENADVR
jgi:hypothetical protein